MYVRSFTEDSVCYPTPNTMSGLLYPELSAPAPSSEPIIDRYALQVPVSASSTEAIINVQVTLKHCPGLCDRQTIGLWLGQSIQKTLHDKFKSLELNATLNHVSDCFNLVMSETDCNTLQTNIGIHSTFIKEISIDIPYQCKVKEVRGATQDMLKYHSTLSMYYQNREHASGSSHVRDFMHPVARQTKVKWDGISMSALAELDLEKNQYWSSLLKTSTNEIKLKLEINDGVVLLAMTKQTSPGTIQRVVNLFQQQQLIEETSLIALAYPLFGLIGGLIHMCDMFRFRYELGRAKHLSSPHQYALPPPRALPVMDIEDCKAYNQNKTLFSTKDSYKGGRKFGAACGLTILSAYVLGRMTPDSAVLSCFLTIIPVILIGPMGAITGLLLRW